MSAPVLPPLPYRRVRLIFRGTVLVTQSWSFGMTVVPSAATLINSELKAYTDSLRTAALTWWNISSGPITQNATDTIFTGINSYFIPANQNSAAAQSSSDFVAPPAGNGSATGPTQVALAVTCLTGQPGRHGKGRFYLPMTAATLVLGHKLANGNQQSIVTATATLMTAINAQALAAGSGVLVVGARQAIPPVITSIRVDNELDIQRRRADQVTASSFISASI